jgi:phosphoglycerate dehydrogenase-like enzyme
MKNTKYKKIVVSDPPFFDDKLLKAVSDKYNTTYVVHDTLAIDPSLIASRIGDAEIAIVDILTDYNESSLRECHNLKHLITATVGYSHIDVEYCRQRGISLYRFSQYNSRAVAELSIALIITLVRKVNYAHSTVKAGLWLTDNFSGLELKSKTIGIIGAGNIGSEVIDIAKGFHMNIMCATAHPTVERAKKLDIDKFYSINEVMQNSDFVVLCIPENKETTNLIDAKILRLLKPSAILVNVARAAILDKYELAKMLHEEKLAGAALDFLGKEPYRVQDDSILIQEMVNRPNVIVTPHIGFNTKESTDRLSSMVAEAVELILSETEVNPYKF